MDVVVHPETSAIGSLPRTSKVETVVGRSSRASTAEFSREPGPASVLLSIETLLEMRREAEKGRLFMASTVDTVGGRSSIASSTAESVGLDGPGFVEYGGKTKESGGGQHQGGGNKRCGGNKKDGCNNTSGGSVRGNADGATGSGGGSGGGRRGGSGGGRRGVVEGEEEV